MDQLALQVVAEPLGLMEQREQEVHRAQVVPAVLRGRVVILFTKFPLMEQVHVHAWEV